jgi:hypothetical protein
LIDELAYNVDSDYVNSDEFLLSRFLLFDKFCLPSVSNQTNKNFIWFVLFNDKLPEKWKIKLDEYKRQFPNFEARFMSAQETLSMNWHATLNRFLIEELKNSNCQFILTTRLDNDDAINLSFVDSIQKYFLAYQEEAVINYINGLQYIPRCNVLRNLTYPQSHFNTLIEKNTQDVQTALGFSHYEVPDNFKSVYLKAKTPMWLETIHSTNVVNTIYFQINNLLNDLFLSVFKYKNLNDFGIKQDIPRFNFHVWKVFFEWFFRKFKDKIILRK